MILEKEIVESDDYSELVEELYSEANLGAAQRNGMNGWPSPRFCDRSMPIRRAGMAMLAFEVSLRLADDTEGTLREARRLWKADNRENVMIQILATSARLPAIEQAISEGTNVNIALLFGQSAMSSGGGLHPGSQGLTSKRSRFRACRRRHELFCQAHRHPLVD